MTVPLDSCRRPTVTPRPTPATSQRRLARDCGCQSRPRRDSGLRRRRPGDLIAGRGRRSLSSPPLPHRRRAPASRPCGGPRRCQPVSESSRAAVHHVVAAAAGPRRRRARPGARRRRACPDHVGAPGAQTRSSPLRAATVSSPPLAAITSSPSALSACRTLPCRRSSPPRRRRRRAPRRRRAQ